MPWPDRALHPNARPHWAVKARVVRDSRDYAAWSAARTLGHKSRWAAATVTLTFCPPDKRRRDLDGMLSACKAMLDGIADATGIDDSRWHLQLVRGEPVKAGAVIVTMEEAAK